jgi:16S rRNA (guanine966-N2)-methyltransferase
MRIISGVYKGRRLKAFQLSHIRPTTDRVKETLFNKLMGRIEDATVLDLFAGTGNLGIEALSRGARHVTFVEKHPASVRLIRENLAVLKIPSDQWAVRAVDVFRHLKDAEKSAQVIFADPPFVQQIANDVMLALAGSRVHEQGTCVAIESASKELISDNYPPFNLLDRRSFGDKQLSLYEREGDIPRQL